MTNSPLSGRDRFARDSRKAGERPDASAGVVQRPGFPTAPLPSCLPGGTAPRCSPRRAVLPAQCGSSLRPNTASASPGECRGQASRAYQRWKRISVSLAATMSQKSSVPQAAKFVSQALKRDKPRNITRRGAWCAYRHLAFYSTAIDVVPTGRSVVPLVRFSVSNERGNRFAKLPSQRATLRQRLLI